MEEEPFDSLGGNANQSTQVRKSTPSVPPSAAFSHGGPPPAAAFAHAKTAEAAEEEEPRTSPVPPSPVSAEEKLPERWKQYTTESSEDPRESKIAMAREREAARRKMLEQQEGDGNSTAMESTPRKQGGYSNYSLFDTPSPNVKGAGLAPRQPYSFSRSESYDAHKSSYKTEDLIRKYGSLTGIPPVVRPTTPSSLQPEVIRSEAMKVLDIVDDHLSTPMDVRRTTSGGFRASPIKESYSVARTESGNIVTHDETAEGEPYAVTRTASGTITTGPGNNGGRRVPAALSGINFSSGKSATAAKKETSWKQGRYSFTDPSFKDDDHISEEEDEIIMSRARDVQSSSDTGDLVDIVKLENRAAGSRVSGDKKFEGDFPNGQQTSWSSRYSDTYATQKKLLDQWDREFEQERTSARQMFMSTASNMRSAASNMISAAESKSSKVFGAGFSFRQNHVYGKHAATEKPAVNLRTVWKDVSERDVVEGPKVHKTWQQVLLNKRKRRRILGFGALVFLVIIAVIATSTKIARNNALKRYSGTGMGGSVTFYVTSDAPYDEPGEDKLLKDLTNLPADGEFVVHLGNIQDARSSLCPASTYSGVASILKKSPVPLFVVPGEHDWVKCPDQEKAMENWSKAFLNFDVDFNHGMRVSRDRDHPEAFAFLRSGVLFLGLHLVNGSAEDESAWKAREMEMLTFYFAMSNLHKDHYRAIVMMGNARPTPQQEEFFQSVFTSLAPINKPLAYVHANSGHGSVREYIPFEEHPDILGVETQNGGDNPLLKITVGFGSRPFLVG